MINPEDLFGKPLRELGIEDVRELLFESDLEPLHWEAKGGKKPEKNEVARQVCGLANSHDGGFLILGADSTDDAGSPWSLNGLEFADEPILWISNVLKNRVRPLPRTDSHAIRVNGERWLVVVHVTPEPTPPCIANGVVYERIPGATISVKDPQRLSRLFVMGDEARTSAIERSRRAARDAIGTVPGFDAERNLPKNAVAASVGIATTGTPPDISACLFSESYSTKLKELARSLAFGSFGEMRPNRMSQSALIAGFHGHDSHDPQGVLCSYWNGATAIAFGIPGITTSNVDHLFDEHLRGATEKAAEMAIELDGFGDFYLSILIRAVPVHATPTDDLDHLRMDRGPLSLDGIPLVVESLVREAKRATGRNVFEPPSI